MSCRRSLLLTALVAVLAALASACSTGAGASTPGDVDTRDAAPGTDTAGPDGLDDTLAAERAKDAPAPPEAEPLQDVSENGSSGPEPGEVAESLSGDAPDTDGGTPSTDGLEATPDEADAELQDPPLADPAEPGPLAWTEATAELKRPGGLLGTTIPLQVFLPEGAGGFPVVVFTHGFQLGPADYRSLAEHLATWGYVVVLPQMPGGLTTHRALKEHLVGVLDWIDAQAAAADGVLYGKADPSRLGLSGHSLGGKISLLVASEDPRPRAAFVVDPVDAAGLPVVLNAADYPSVTPELMPYVSVPLGLLGETTDAACSGFLCQACAPAEDNFAQYYLFAQSPAVSITLNGAGHMSFLDNPDCGLVCSLCNPTSDDPATTRRLTRRYLTAFYHVGLKDWAGYRDYLAGAAMAADVQAGLVTSASKHGF